MTNRAWQDAAACLNHVQVFFPHKDNEADTTAAKKICGICPVRQACLEAAMTEERAGEHIIRAGIRGGLTPRQRAALSRRLRRRAAAKGSA
ncbi:WhiB family transcriptional regulator [Streptomyces sp. NPDC102274]|uniref:WhiB family transcriptional regulator n=1 Tax=Streptomyces sp. NPDC102274 TaxID=3366151 RepID=UPI003814FB80